MRAKLIGLLIWFIALGVNAQVPKNFCLVRLSLEALAKSGYLDTLESSDNNKLNLIRQFLIDNTDTIYTGFFKYNPDLNIRITNNSDYFFHDIQTWFYIDSISTNSDSIYLWLHNDSMKFIESIKHYNFKFLYIASTNKLTLIYASEDLNYTPLLNRGRIMTPEQQENEANIVSSFLIRNNFGKDIKCNE